MTPAARVSAAIEILDALGARRGADRLLLRWGRANRYAGSGDRAAVADIVYDALRRRRSLAWRMGAETGRALTLGLLAADGRSAEEIAALFSGARFAPAPLTNAERARLDGAPPPAPDAVRLDVPDWLEPELRRSLGDAFVPALEAMQERAAVDLRVNSLKADVSAAQAALAADGVETEPGPLSPLCLRVVSGARRLRGASAYRDGRVEIQDAASQAVARFAAARPGARALDFCAGGGGKTLALAADMEGRGELWAHDADPGRMADLPERARRAGVRARLAERPAERLRGACDLVLADAPCSGSGAWRRNPDAKWALTEAELLRYRETQRDVLRAAAECVAPGGRLVYATCSLLRAENRDAAEAFLSDAPFELTRELRLTPADGGDGLYAAEMSLASR